jgi:carbon storage regulator CsrA
MLVLTRDKGQAVRVGETIITIYQVRGESVRLTFDGPRDVEIVRCEIDRRNETERPRATDRPG